MHLVRTGVPWRCSFDCIFLLGVKNVVLSLLKKSFSFFRRLNCCLLSTVRLRTSVLMPTITTEKLSLRWPGPRPESSETLWTEVSLTCSCACMSWSYIFFIYNIIKLKIKKTCVKCFIDVRIFAYLWTHLFGCTLPLVAHFTLYIFARLSSPWRRGQW